MKASRFQLLHHGGVLLLLFLLPCSLSAQTALGTLRGRVTDPSGAVIPKATVTAAASNGQQSSAVSNSQGVYEIKALEPGTYTVTAVAKGFALLTQANVVVSPGVVQQFDIGLEIQVKQEKVEVEEQSTTVNTTASDNASSIVIRGKDLEALSDDPDELQQDLEALAGPSAGPNGGQIYIDGFTGGQLPPKASIREIRINQNPFSSEYDKLGYGRIEIFTKPGTDRYHGQFFLDGNDSAFNSLNPFTPNVPAYDSEFFNASVGGPLSKKASFFFSIDGRHINDSNIVNAVDPNTFGPFVQAVPNPRTRLNLGPRIDYQVSKNNTLTARYQFFHNTEDNEGVGQLSLPSQEYNSSQDEHTLQISDTQVVSNNVVNETRFQFVRDTSSQIVPSFDPTVDVLGAFVKGGNQQGSPTDHQNRYELQNYTSVVHGSHFLKFGGRLRATTDSNYSDANFNGLWTFSSLTAYQDAKPSQFSITRGQQLLQASILDAGLYAQDDWRIRPSLTLSYGVRFETQNDIQDHGDWAPRLAVAWGLGRGNNPSPKTVLRAGVGVFYDRFGLSTVEQAERLNGTTQQQFIVTNPDSYPVFPSLANSQIPPTVYQISPTLRAPMTLQSAASIERQVIRQATVAVTYLNTRGEHQLFLRNINAPYPGTFVFGDPTKPGIVPYPGAGNIYQYSSEGIFRQNQLITNVRINTGARLSLFGYYTLNYSNSNLGSGGGGAGANFISNQYNPMADYGRSSFDVRHRAFFGGTLSMPYAVRLSPFLLVASGAPYDITTGTDLNGDSIFNDRPVLAATAICPAKTGLGANIVCTPLGTFNTLPAPGQALIPVNSATGPTLFTLNVRLTKTFGLGRETKGGGSADGPGYGGGRRGGPPGGGLGPGGLSGAARPSGGMFGMGGVTNRRYNLTFGVSARNVLNRVNLASPVGNLASPLFAESIALAGGPYSSSGASRRIDLQVLFSF